MSTEIRAATVADVPQVVLGGVPVSRLDRAQTLELLGEWMDAGVPRTIATANLDFLEIAHRDEDLHRCLVLADLVTADGAPLVWLSHWAREPIAERVTGSDLGPALMEIAAERGWKVYFLGGQDGVGQEVVDVLTARHPDLQVAGWSEPFIDLDDEDGCRAAARQVADSGADLVLVAFGCPKQDLFIERHLHDLGATLAVGVGGTFNFIAGRISRAPKIIQALQLEWVHRMWKEPRRFLPRYWRDALYLLKLAGSVTRLRPRLTTRRLTR
mgnify:CR=1 FL=1